MKTKIAVLIFLFAFLINMSAQRGFQIGIGIMTIPGNKKTIDTEYNETIYISGQYGMALHTDYTISDNLRIKSGLEYQFQNVSVNHLYDFRAEYFTLPLLVNYNFPKIKKYGLTLGLDGGFSMDKLLKDKQFYYYSSTYDNDGFKINVDMESNKNIRLKAFDFNCISWRFGLNVQKDMGPHGHLNFYVQSINPRFSNFLTTIKISKQYIKNSIPDSEINYEKEINLRSSQFQFGLFYTFGALGFKN